MTYLKSGTCTIIMKKYTREATVDTIFAHLFDENPIFQTMEIDLILFRSFVYENSGFSW